MEKKIVKKVVVYCQQGEKLLVFRHIDFSYKEVGIQVPAGTVKESEKPEEAALRNVREFCCNLDPAHQRGFSFNIFLILIFCRILE